MNSKRGFNKYNVKVGDKFNKWTIINEPFSKNRSAWAKCQCDCGTIRDNQLSKLKCNRSKSCGCFISENTTKMNLLTKRKCSIAENGKKKCSVCQEYKSIKSFDDNNATKDFLLSKCKLCRKKSRIKRLYNITSEIFDLILTNQNNSCQICGKKQHELNKGVDFCVDHNHNLNYPHARGILCSLCNKALGLFFDSTENLHNAINYLQKTEKEIYIDGTLTKINK